MARILDEGGRPGFVGRLRRYYWQWQFDRRLPARARLENARDCRSPLPDDPGPHAAIEASLAWLGRAQDCSTSADGGVARHFSLISGWGESYPETTGYIIPTMLACGRSPRRHDLLRRARRMLDWCVEVQLPSGAFQAGTISARPRAPSSFNTGQVLLGLAAGASLLGDARYVRAMHGAAAWLAQTQDDDGCWRRFPTPFAEPGEKAYETHAAWALFEAARIAPGAGYGEAGLKQVRWALTKQRDNGWFADCCLDDPARPLTHTIGYALRGILEAYRYRAAEEFLVAARRTGRALLWALEPDGRLPGRLDADWHPAASWACLTGTVQIADCWLMLFEHTREPGFLDGARRANAFVRRTVKITGDLDMVGGIKGSFPVSGDYGAYAYLSWAAKFFVDSNRHEVQLTK